MADYPEII
jgi:hypothetical protein